jgi:membrane-bound lytic murein transglycosylase D
MTTFARAARWLQFGAGAALAVALAGCAGLSPSQALSGDAVQPAVAGNAATEPSRVFLDATFGVSAAAAPATTPLAATSERSDSRAPVVTDALRPDARIDLSDGNARTDLWARVRAGLALPEIDDELVRKWEQWYASRPDYVQRMTGRGGRSLFHVMEEIDRRGLPADLALLPFIESAFNPQAVSVAAASGMWQFMPATGKDFELRQNIFRDDRRDVLASTRAALDYLAALNRRFSDWQLALAAYNWGPGNVQRAIDRNLKAGLAADYASLRMPDETRNYLPKLQAVRNIVMQPERFGLALPRLENHPYFVSVAIERDIDVAMAARLAVISMEEFQQLNPQMNKPVILAAGTTRVLLPYDNANLFLRGLASHQGALATWTVWKAPKTLKPAEAAQLVGMSEAQLREVNRIPAKMLVKQGSTLLVPRDGARTDDVAIDIADRATMSLAPEHPPLRKLSFKAGKKGDSVAAVAQRYRVSPADVATWNGVGEKASFKPGQPVVVMLSTSPTKIAAKGSAANAPKHSTRSGSVRVASK